MIVLFAGPVTPSTTGFELFMTTPAPGGTPPLQFDPTIQSLLVFPVQVWAAAGPARRAATAIAAPARIHRAGTRGLLLARLGRSQ